MLAWRQAEGQVQRAGGVGPRAQAGVLCTARLSAKWRQAVSLSGFAEAAATRNKAATERRAWGFDFKQAPPLLSPQAPASRGPGPGRAGWVL